MGDFNTEYDEMKSMFSDLGLVIARNLGGTRFDKRQKKWSDIDHFLSTKVLPATSRLQNLSNSDHSPISVEYEF